MPAVLESTCPLYIVSPNSHRYRPSDKRTEMPTSRAGLPSAEGLASVSSPPPSMGAPGKRGLAVVVVVGGSVVVGNAVVPDDASGRVVPGENVVPVAPRRAVVGPASVDGAASVPAQ